MDNSTTASSSNTSNDTRANASSGTRQPSPPMLPNRPSLDQPPPPPYSIQAGYHGSTLITSPAPPGEDRLFQVLELARQYSPSATSYAGSSSSSSPSSLSLSSQSQFLCADTMHDQQYLLIGSANALHSIDLTLPQDKQLLRTHIQGVSFKEIHCLEDLGLIVVIAGRNSRVRCYDYEAIKSLVAYGHSKEGQSRVVEGGKLGSMKNMIQLRVETVTAAAAAAQQDSSTGRNHHHHRQSSSIDRTLLSPLQAESPGSSPGHGSGSGTEDERDSFTKRSKPRPISFGGLASLAQDQIMKNKNQQQQQQQQQQPSTTPNITQTPPPTTSPNTGNKSKRLSQMASYLSNAAANSTMAAQILNTNSQDSPSEEAVSWAWNFSKVKQTKDAMALDFHYTSTTVYMTVLSRAGIDIYSRPKTNRRGPAWLHTRSHHNGIPLAPRARDGPQMDSYETPGRPSTSSLGGEGGGGMVSASISLSTNDQQQYEWKPYKHFYHPEAPSFMTVVKNTQDITDIILGKGPRACVINVSDMSVTDLHRQENSSNGNVTFQGLGKKLGFKSSVLWHSFEKIPFDVPSHILFPSAVEAIYGRRDEKGSGHRYGQQQERSVSAYTHNRSSTIDTFHPPPPTEQDPTIYRAGPPPAGIISLPLELDLSSSGSSSSSSPEMKNRSSQDGDPRGRASYDGSRRVTKTRMVTSDQVLNMAFCQSTTTQLFLATYGSQSRIVDLYGKPQSPVVLEWGNFPPQSVEFLKTSHDIYVVGFEKTSIVVFSLTRAKKVKEILKRDLIQSSSNQSRLTSGQLLMDTTRSSSTSPPSLLAQSPPSTSVLSSASIASTLSSVTASTTAIKYLGRDNVAEDSMGLFFSYLHPKNGTSICKLAVVSASLHDEPPPRILSDYYAS
ncbi:hypothetical protein BGZ83_000602 [Gryganskiella cystojenkinii]|nr:hypothetical protein BGZ83_000602 [Gryganskiella cystojenkinii]